MPLFDRDPLGKGRHSASGEVDVDFKFLNAAMARRLARPPNGARGQGLLTVGANGVRWHLDGHASGGIRSWSELTGWTQLNLPGESQLVAAFEFHWKVDIDPGVVAVRQVISLLCYSASATDLTNRARKFIPASLIRIEGRTAAPMQPDSIAHKYDVPPEPRRKGPPSDSDLLAGAMHLVESRPPDDAWAELVGAGVIPPGHLWPLTFCRKPLDFWGRDNIVRCKELLDQDGDSTSQLAAVLGILERLDAGTQLSGHELLEVANAFGCALVARLLEVSIGIYADQEDLLAKLEPTSQSLFDGLLDGRCAHFLLWIHQDMKYRDWRIGVDMGVPAGEGASQVLRWNPRSPASVFSAAVFLIEKHASKVVADLEPRLRVR
jgi:hypothetical protein